MTNLSMNFITELLDLMKMDGNYFGPHLIFNFKITSVDELLELIKVTRNHNSFTIRILADNRTLTTDIIKQALEQQIELLSKGNLIKVNDIVLNELIHIANSYGITEYDNHIKEILDKSVPVTMYGYREEIHYKYIRKTIDEKILSSKNW